MSTIPYRPSNGFEGMTFMDAFCDRCKRDAAFRAGTGSSCLIAAATFVYGADEPQYPIEWVSDPDGDNPRCTAFEPEET